MAAWVFAAEQAYVAYATGGARPASTSDAPTTAARAQAAAGAIASRFLAVGTPRSLGLIAETVDEAHAAALSLEAHRTWFKPTDLRCAGTAGNAVAEAIGGRVTSVAEALACDIVCIHAPLRLEAVALRRGTHVNVLAPGSIDDELTARAWIVHEEPELGELAAGLIDGRQLDEITVFVLGTADLARSAVGA